MTTEVDYSQEICDVCMLPQPAGHVCPPAPYRKRRALLRYRAHYNLPFELMRVQPVGPEEPPPDDVNIVDDEIDVVDSLTGEYLT